MKIKPRPSLFLWTFICVFLVFWLGLDLWSGIYKGEIQDLRTGNQLLLENRPVWFYIVFILKLLAMMACFYFLVWRSTNSQCDIQKSKKEKAKII